MLWAVRACAAFGLLVSAKNLDYAPTSGHVCPAQFLRNAKGLSQEEAAYISNRLPIVRKALYDFLSETGFPDFNLDALFDKGGVPKVAFAASGGGLRAMLVGGSIMRALDSRTQVGTGLSTLGGLLQSSSYMTGLSGGSWLVASSVTNDFATVDELAHKVWSLNTAMTPPKRGFFTFFRYFASILEQIRDKAKHFKVTIVDFWSRGIIAYHVLGRENGQIRAHWSQTTELASFKNFNMPYPIVLSLFRPRGGGELQLNASVMEMLPYEFGTWDAPFHAFAKTKNIGTKVFNGKPVNPNDCVEGYDNVGFIIGISSSLFCASMSNNLDGKIVSELQRLLDKDDYDVGIIPNLFKGLPGLNPELGDDEYLTLVDGGLA
jgi:lysophospholipase